MAVDPRLALMGADPSGPVNAFMMSRDNARAGVFQEQKMAADAAKSAAEARSAKLGQLANFAFRVAREPIQTRGPLLEQAKMAAISLYGNDPQVTQILSQVTPENVEGYASALVSIKDQLDAGKTDADIANVYNTMSNRDRATTSGINVDNAQIGNYGASAANYRDQIRSRQGQDMATGYGQVPEGYIMGPEGAAPIPGVPLAAKGAPGGVKPPAGYRFTPDGQALEAIPGGPAAAKLAGQDFAAQQALEKVDMTMGKIDQALGQVSGWTAGPGSYLSMIPGTGARDLEATLATVKANLGFNELAAMRAASPTGGALGQVTERELAFLQSTLAALDTAQSPEQLRQNLMQVKEHYNRWRAAMAQAENPNAGAGITAGPADPGVDALLQKYGVQ